MRVMYVAVVEVETRREVDRDAALKLLGEYSPTFGRSPRGWAEVELRISATGLAHACTKASALARAALGAESIACEVMTQQEHRARNGGVDDEAPQAAANGRHVASEEAPWLPRQASQPWDRAQRPPGRHSA
jgi:hypothetical protein